MPGCVLRISGESFDVDRFLSTSGLQPYRIYHRGKPTGRRLGEHQDVSGFCVQVSDVDGDVRGEVSDAIAFLCRWEGELGRLAQESTVTDRRLDFGYHHRDVFVQSEYFPPELLRLSGAHGIGIELSLYPQPGDLPIRHDARRP